MDRVQQCVAKSKQSGKQCKNFAVSGKKVCRFHGGLSTGPKTIEGRRRIAEARTKHGRYTKEAVEERREFRRIERLMKKELKDILSGKLTY